MLSCVPSEELPLMGICLGSTPRVRTAGNSGARAQSPVVQRIYRVTLGDELVADCFSMLEQHSSLGPGT